jgi:hypothetical protein
VAWHNRNKTIHFRLERILTQKEWIQIIARWNNLSFFRFSFF